MLVLMNEINKSMKEITMTNLYMGGEDLPDDSLKLEDVMANAPRREGDFIRIRPVLE